MIAGPERVYLNKEAAGTVEELTTNPLTSFDHLIPTTLEQWDQDKKRRNTLTAFMIYFATVYARENIVPATPFGLLYFDKEAKTYAIKDTFKDDVDTSLPVETQIEKVVQRVSQCMQETMFLAITNTTTTFLDDEPPASFKGQLAQQLEHMTRGFWEGGKRREEKPVANLIEFLNRGEGSAMRGVEIPYLALNQSRRYQGNVIQTPEELVTIMQHIYPFLVPLASGHFDTHIPIMNIAHTLMNVVPLYQPPFVGITHEQSGEHTVLADKNELSEFEAHFLPDARSQSSSVTTGCPGLVAYDIIQKALAAIPDIDSPYKNAIEEQYRWHINATEMGLREIGILH